MKGGMKIAVRMLERRIDQLTTVINEGARIYNEGREIHRSWQESTNKDISFLASQIERMQAQIDALTPTEEQTP